MAKKATLRNEETTVERSKLKAKTDLIAALIQYRESAKAAGRYKLSDWAHVQLARVATFSHVSEDLRLQDAVAAFHKSCVAPQSFTEDMLRGFRNTLRDDELEALLDATN
ncbi:MAG TPA: hypothetical protein VFF95_18585 [Candidatus Binatus sp.]|jgi:hypothetical protein|nr:hypothetical protein [Candidatus Binatus sp.]